jgi:hypothetical protein
MGWSDGLSAATIRKFMLLSRVDGVRTDARIH